MWVNVRRVEKVKNQVGIGRGCTVERAAKGRGIIFKEERSEK